MTTDEAPMRLELKAMTFGELIDGALKIYRRHMGLLFGLSLLVSVPTAFLNRLSGVGVPGQLPNFGPVMLGLLWASAAGIFVNLFMQMVVADVVYGRPVSLGGTLARCSGKWGPFILASIQFGIVTMLGLLCFVVPGIIYLFRRILYGAAIVFENVDGPTSLQRSKKLVGKFRAGRADRAIVIAIIVGILSAAFSAGVGAVMPAMVAPFIAAIAQSAFTPLYPISTGLIYLDARVRDEGFDLEVRSQAQAASQGA